MFQLYCAKLKHLCKSTVTSDTPQVLLEFLSYYTFIASNMKDKGLTASITYYLDDAYIW